MTEKPSSPAQREYGDNGHRPGIAEDDIHRHCFEERALDDHKEMAQGNRVGNGLEPVGHVLDRCCESR